MSKENSQREAEQQRRIVDLFTAKTPEEDVKIREERRRQYTEQQKLAHETFAKQIHDERVGAKEASKEYGQSYVRVTFLLNGGSILALMTFIGAIFGKGDVNAMLVAISLAKHLYPAFLCFILGLVCSAVTSAISYLNWSWIYESHMQAGDLYLLMNSLPWDPAPINTDRNITLSFWAALATAIGALVCFIAGALFVVRAFTVLGVD
ncbi:cell envelope integrity protein TolA [Microvirga sp. CF3016]|uniref:cell envelope integrity protein TolA n=1 Tax=Microvirga sp. CF3016 TaxID=3110181 RepID=UPI002E7852FE|nr:hypothetical protein [Microvirga sp. CF3016]MEE1612083.1 hypothetical protein [Microvirga sp. CF3016]